MKILILGNTKNKTLMNFCSDVNYRIYSGFCYKYLRKDQVFFPYKFKFASENDHFL